METQNVVEMKKGKMITINYKTLNNDQFNQALGMLSNQTGFANFQASYNVAKLTRQFQEELKIAREEYAKWTEEFIVKDEKGERKMATKPHPTCPWEIKEGMAEAFEAEMAKFLNTEVKIWANPIQIADLGRIQLAPAQVLALEPIFDPSAFAQPEPSTH